jgi:hypothetical protein
MSVFFAIYLIVCMFNVFVVPVIYMVMDWAK